MAIGTIIELDEVEGLDTRGEVKEVNAEDYDLPLARALKAIEYDETLAHKAWLKDGLEEVLALFDLSDEYKDILRSRNLETLKTVLAEEAEEAGVPSDHIIVWALVRIENN